MIVDMVRNDLARIAAIGSIEVTDLCDVERYPTVLQMTSTVKAHTRASLVDIMAALFPSASITGAPKVRTMEIIRNLERDPRGLYTGAIGFIEPGRHAHFNVAIHAAVV
jgi:para-aminobenzoate synthetase/4-amino-4-deoxychorismate lyase